LGNSNSARFPGVCALFLAGPAAVLVFMPHSPMGRYIAPAPLESLERREEVEMKRSFVRALSLVSLLAVPAGLIAQAATAPAPTTTTTTTTEKKAATGTRKVKKHHKKMHHHAKSTAPAMSPTPTSK
jgi:hypothetical protein